MAKEKWIKVEITETLQRTVEVKAENGRDAIEKVKDMYRNEDIVLSSEDFIDSNFQVIVDQKGE